jgi:hypothetical protein
MDKIQNPGNSELQLTCLIRFDADHVVVNNLWQKDEIL